MRKLNEERILAIAQYIVFTGSTVRATAPVFGISKSTVFRDMNVNLEGLNKRLYEDVRKVLDKNKAERHIRGGEATRKKYIKE